jgi:hypothetical protein
MTPEHLAMEAARKRKRAKRAAHRERSLEGHSRPASEN